jgi:hypothetical protein
MMLARRKAINWLRVYTWAVVFHSDGGIAELGPVG